MMVFQRTPMLRKKNIQDAKARLREVGKLLRRLKNHRIIRARKTVHEILHHWSSLNEIG